MLTLLYHNVLAAPRDEWPVAYRQTTAATFRAQVRRLRRRLLHPREVHEALQRGQTPRGVLLTFDDGAAGILDAARILAEHGVAGVAFICPGALHGGLWFYRLADALARTPLARWRWGEIDLPLGSPQNKRQAYRTLSPALFALPEAEREAQLQAISAHLQPTGAPPEALSILEEDGLRAAAATGGLCFANHSWSHPDLTRLAPDALECEIDRAADWLEASGLPMLPWFAFPRGVHNATVRAAVARRHAVAFGATMHETTSGVLPRCYLCELDANPRRFALKTLGDGLVYQLLERRRQSGQAGGEP